MKKILCLISLSFTMIIGILTCEIKAMDKTKYPTVRELLNSGDLDLRELSMAEPLSLEDTIAASISIYTNPKLKISSGASLGHSWIVIKNYNQTRTYGTYSTQANKSFTMGTFGNKGYNGIWYNVESAERSNIVASDTFYLKTAIMGDKISTFRNSIASYNYWNVGQNCAYFASNMWNKAGGSKISVNTIETPASLASKIKEKSGYKTGISDADFVNASKSVSHY